jgi:translation initiation factor 2B subunit (eIF-2B alpha/beta/delta family)
MEDAWRAVMAAARDETSGAAEIARAAADALLGLDPGRVPSAVGALIRGHPSMAPLWRLGSEALSADDHRDGVRRFLRMLNGDAAASGSLAHVLPSTVLTISWSSTVIAALSIRRPDRVVCMRSDPGGEGERTAASLRAMGIDAVVMKDAEALVSVPAEAVATGADAVTPDAVVNKIVTRALAEAARSRGVPRYAVAASTKLLSEAIPLGGPFEATPLGLFTGIALPAGILTPDAAKAEAVGKVVHPALLPLMAELRAGSASRR